MNATLYYHLRNERHSPRIECVARPATGEHDVPYYELHLGDAVLFVDDGLCRRILDVLASRPELPKTDAEPECTCVDGLSGASPDRLVGADGLLELKCPALETHVGYMLDPASLVAKTDAEPECTCVLVGDMADATDCEVHREGGALAAAMRNANNNISGGEDAEF